MGLKVKLSFIFLITCFFTVCSCGSDLPIENKIQKVLDKGISKYNVKGASVAVMLPDEKKWIGVSGISHDTVQIKPDMLFAIGSITKNFVATLTLKLAEEGVLSLDDPLSNGFLLICIFTVALPCDNCLIIPAESICSGVTNKFGMI